MVIDEEQSFVVLHGWTEELGIGNDASMLLARVRFASTADDQVPVDEVGGNLGPYDMQMAFFVPNFGKTRELVQSGIRMMSSQISGSYGLTDTGNPGKISWSCWRRRCRTDFRKNVGQANSGQANGQQGEAIS